MWNELIEMPDADPIDGGLAGLDIDDTHVMVVVHRADQVAHRSWTPSRPLCANSITRARDVAGIRLALEEAIVNGLRHGNKNDPSKRVYVSFLARPDDFVAEVKDEGTGFDLSQVPDPTLPENWTRPSGRGLLLMRHYMTAVHFSRRGSCVTMSKIRTA